ncbi:phage tail protein [Erwinia sp. OLTSP20]|uniref:tail fiber assembly protein n=1 Tax=unclassified Erwinia TaxID=2622719 RepID=UPI000C191674|nr:MULTISPECIES: tail fiber assembly protein [unclassified Erwinia]PIJ48072.1 phage tail protein [Erwinia sp. OAMSP11]PIJ65419.1 phage tail protein [Erwinia sp. OLSSP12]PIJ77805.1 phage tail protein [Erwinia sp. OLCASP19]PIJ78780.1 phage tail protein [Erwinia sp. OLMTSP26]PIJ79112.1 phage tail protein [Erwinia sp. OLMDSP33]
MTFKMSEEAQTITIYNLRADTLEFIGASDAYIPPHTGLPANCTDIEPPESDAGKVAIFDDKKTSWSQVEDHRGKTVFDTESGSAVYISDLGPLPAGTTSIAPDGQYQKWNGKEWVKDNEAEKAAQLREMEDKKASLMQVASDEIALLQDAVDLDMATDEEKQALIDWKKYCVLLSRVDYNKPEWPEQPTL